MKRLTFWQKLNRLNPIKTFWIFLNVGMMLGGGIITIRDTWDITLGYLTFADLTDKGFIV